MARLSETQQRSMVTANNDAPVSYELPLPLQAGERRDKGPVAELAYILYEERGREDGHDLEDWVEAEAALPTQLTWTTEKPTKLGIYWFKGRVSGTGFERDDFGPTVVELVGEGPSFGVGVLTSESSFTISELNGQWTGPLKPPT